MAPDLDSTTRSPYAERLRLGPLGWAVLVGLATMLTISLVPISSTLAFAVGAVALVGAVAVALVTAPRVELAGGTLRAGSAVIPVDLLGPARALDRAETRHELGPGLDARAYLCLCGWIGTAVKITVDDPQDPTPYWIVSTRHPAELAAALGRTTAVEPA